MTGERATQQPAVAGVLAALAVDRPLPAARGAAALNVVMRDIACSPRPEEAWTFSDLTYGGFPLEFTFVSAEEAIRYTADVGGPETDPAERLGMAMAHLSMLDSPLPPPHLLTQLADLQRGAPLHYGAWLGGRHDVGEDYYKIYVEVPAPDTTPAQDLIQERLGSERLLVDRRYELRMVGYMPSTGHMELYFRGIHLQPYHMRLLLERAGLGKRHRELVAAVDGCYKYPRQGRWPIYKIGFSYSFAGGEAADAFSFFVPARKLFGSDASTRQRLSTLCAERGWSLVGYDRASAPLASGTKTQHCHGMMGFTVAGDRPLAAHIGLSPPSPQ
jgi:hypothetical protein